MDQDPGHFSNSDGPDWEAVGRFLAGESTDGEAAVVRQWLERSPRDAAFIAILDRATAAYASVPVDVEGALRRVHARLDEPTVLPLIPRRSPFLMGGPRSPVLAIAAALTLLVGGTVMWRSTREPAGYAPAIANAAQHYSTGVGERDTVALADGSVVVLGPASELTTDPGGGERRVTLRGEAFFIVKHDEARPFVVHAGPVAIRDVGTEFSVRNSDGAPLRVAVTEGVVAVRGESSPDEITLHAGDVATRSADGQLLAQRRAVVEADTAWKEGQLVFADADMGHVRDGLRRWYGVEIRFDSMLAHRHVTATFRGETVERVLDVIALTLGARVERRGDTASLNTLSAPR